MVRQNVDVSVPGIDKVGTESSNEVPDLVRVEQTPVRCKKCGWPGAILHLEEWSDGLVYSDYGCSNCGYTEVY